MAAHLWVGLPHVPDDLLLLRKPVYFFAWLVFVQDQHDSVSTQAQRSSPGRRPESPGPGSAYAPNAD
jgi:hypothetical protein